MSPPKKRKTKTKKPSPTLGSYSISSLPDDLVLSCLARVSRSYYPILSLVSKKFRSLIASPQLYNIRSLLGRAESCLYVCLKRGTFPRWFTLCRRPNTMTTKKKQKQSLVPIPFPDSPQAQWPKVVAIGSSIYFIGGLIHDEPTSNVGFIDYEPTSNVSILDCRSHTWHQGPNFQAARISLSASVVDEKIYVVGRPVNNESSWIEVFDPKTQTWNSVSGQRICEGELISGSIEIDGKICMYTESRKDVAYNPKDATFEPLDWTMPSGWLYISHCVVDNLLFCYYDHVKVFKWFDTKARLWRDLKGLEGILRKIAKHSCVKLADYGGKIAVLWDKCFSSKGCEEKMIWFADISLERRHNDEEEEEIWGRVEFVDCVLTLPNSYNVWKAVSATL